MVVAMVDELELFKLSEQKRVDLAYYTKNPEILKVLAGDPDGYIRQGVSVNPNTPAGTLTVLAADVNDNIRNYVAANPNTPKNVLTALAADLNENVRSEVAGNPNTPVNILTVLASDVNDDTRWRIARNFAVPDELLWCLLTDTDKDVVDRVTARLQTKNLSLTDFSWVDPTVLKKIYVTLQTNNTLNTSILIQLLKAKIVLTQSELIDLCELYDNDIRDTIKTNYELTHPLLKQILTTSEKHVQNNNTKINYLSFH